MGRRIQTNIVLSALHLHSYQPTAKDIAKIASADMFVYVDGELDGWVDDTLKEASLYCRLKDATLEVLK